MLECLNKFCSTYDDALLRWNGADLMTKVINRISSKADKSSLQLDIKLVSQFAFHPISSANITRCSLSEMTIFGLFNFISFSMT